MGTNTGIGIGIGIPFKNFSSGGRQPLPPDLKASLKGVWIAYGKSNNDADRSIVKNLVDPDNPFVISNAAFKLNSGFGKYETELSNTRIWTQSKETTSSPFSSNYNGLSGWIVFANTELTNSADMPSFKIQVKGLLEGQELIYRYYDSTGQTNVYSMTKDGEYTLPADVRTAKPLTSNTSGFQIVKNETNIITITQIPSFEGAFVTDGINDLITSTKTVQEMLGGSNEITVVSMIHQIGLIPSQSYARNNYFIQGNDFLTNTISAIGKIGIYGYKGNLSNIAIVNDILGDKKDYSVDKANPANIDSVFSVNGTHSSAQLSSVAWYWTFIANKVLTTDEINQVIAYFNLDKTLKPDILCNITKQGITNDNHADFNDKLIDYSGNGRDIQMNNLAWKGGSGIAAKPFETIKDYTILSNETRQELTIYNEFSYKVKSNSPNRYWVVQSIIKDNTSYQVTIITDKDCYWINSTSFTNNEGNKESIKKEYPVKANTPTQVTICGLNEFEYPEDIKPTAAVSYVNLNYAGEVTVTFIPSCKGGLLLDGVNDFGQFVGDLGLKDYTLIINRAYNNLINNQVPLISSNIVEDQTPFIVEHWNTGSNAISFSYGASCTTDIPLDINKKIVYQSTYSYMGYVIPKGNAISTGNGITLGRFGNGVQYSAICLWSLMLFPYSMSEFLIERQLKKHKLGTLYPDMVEWRPIIKSNVEYGSISYLLRIPDQGTVAPKIGQYYPILSTDTSLVVYVATNGVDEVANLTINGQEPTSSSIHTDGRFKFEFPFTKSPQKINITIDEYIRYEDIVQPYPVLLRFKDENGNEVSWGGKFKVGSTITRIGSIADPESNLLNGLYSVSGLSLNGKVVTSSTSIVEKQMVFKTTATWLLDNNAPKCILSPRLLRIPNSSYKILGYIPDISGHGNHGKINNSAYGGISGANGYKQDFTSWKTNGSSYSIVTDSKYILTNEKAITNSGYFLWNRLAKDSFKVKISNIPNGGWMSYRYRITEEDTQFSSLFIREDGIYTLPTTIADSDVDFFISTTSAPAEDWIGLTIEQIGEYEGAYCLDGVDDFVTIPTIVGGKQVLMKMNWQNRIGLLYDQRKNGSSINAFAILNVDSNNSIAYNNRNTDGETYIDGILNKNIVCPQLYKITHSITIINQLANKKEVISPTIGSGTTHKTYFSQMSLYDFMLFDNISTDDKIKQLNEYVGIEAKVELPPYYWDAYGKTNLDADRDTIQQRGVAVGDYDITNYNHAYEGMSGYNGYPVVFGANKTWANESNGYVTSITSNTIHITNVLNAGLALLYSYVKYNGNLQNIKEIPSFKIEIKGLEGRSKFIYKYLATSDATKETNLYLGNGTHELPKSFLPTEALINNAVVGFSISPIEEGVTNFLSDITIEVLPEYENGLAYNGVSDFTDNKNIPILTDFTFIIKREILGLETNESMLVIKGDKVYNNGIGNAFILEHNNNGVNYVYSYGKLNQIKRDDSKIIYLTPKSYNGNPIIKGENGDNLGLVLSRHWRGIIYKTILYSKTISLLQINFLKNLMEKDEIIDLNNPIFIKNE